MRKSARRRGEAGATPPRACAWLCMPAHESFCIAPPNGRKLQLSRSMHISCLDIYARLAATRGLVALKAR